MREVEGGGVREVEGGGNVRRGEWVVGGGGRLK